MEGKLLILGSTLGTYDIAVEAKRMGLYVITADYLPTSPTKEISDEAWLVNTADIDELERLCREHNVGGITFGASDFNMTKSLELCRRLDLPWYSANDYAAIVARDKSEFRKVCEKAGVPIATGLTFTERPTREILDTITYPVVIKPVDRAGNIGMSYCDNEEELLRAYDKALNVSDKNIVVCERRLYGRQWTANYVLANGEARLIYFAANLHERGRDANLYSIMHTTANGLRQYLEDANEKVKTLFKEAGFENGIAWVETMQDQDGHFYIIEPAYRLGGETFYDFYQKVRGFNSLRWIIESAMGVQHSIDDLPEDLATAYTNCVGSYFLFADHEGTITSIEGLDELAAMPYVTIDLASKRLGEVIPKGPHMGLIRMYAPNVDAMIETLKKINEVFSIKDENGENLFIRFTGYDELKKDFEAGLADFAE